MTGNKDYLNVSDLQGEKSTHRLAHGRIKYVRDISSHFLNRCDHVDTVHFSETGRNRSASEYIVKLRNKRIREDGTKQMGG